MGVGKDDIEIDTGDLATGLSICSGDDCRDPREGPFVIDLNANLEGPRCLCYRCFVSDVLRMDPEEFAF